MSTYVVGIDIGSRGAKGILMKDHEIAASFIGDTGPESVKTAWMVLENLLKQAGLKGIEDVRYTMATGYGRVLVPFANENISEISAHAKGINWYYPSVRTILDMGGQDCKAISVDQSGAVTNFVMNDKCAGGTGRFLEMIADVLGVPLADVGKVALESRSAIPFNTICAVFAKTEAITAQRKGVPRPDILAGLNDAIATRSLNLLKRVGIQPDFSITGGIAKNKGMVAKIVEKVGMEPRLAPDPQLMGALGAALYGIDKLHGGMVKAMKANYGYSDGSGNYFVTVDGEKCDACGLCLPVCPAGLFEIGPVDGGENKAKIKDTLRRKLAQLCPGAETCRRQLKGKNCQTVCPKGAISHSW